MPHGGGHVSHGGGGHFGGGHHHHHHFGGHHHRHRHYGGVVYTTGVGGYYYRSRYRGCVWGGVGIVLAIVIIVVVSCSVTLSKEEDEENRYSPGDTRIKKFDTFFCSGVKTSATGYFEKNANAYIIKDNPPLSVRNNVSFDDTFTLYEDDYNYWHFHLYENSNISLDGCVSSGSGYWFYIIKGTSKWNDWKDYASSSKAVYSSYITAQCSDTPTSIKYRVRSSGHYYIAYYNDLDSFVSGQQTLHLSRFEYAVPEPSNLVSSCSFAGPSTSSGCKLQVPMLSDNSKVLVRFPLEASNTEDTFHVDIDCTPRAEAYVIVVVPPLVFVAMVVFIVVTCVVCYVRSKKKAYKPLVDKDTSNTVGAPTDVPPPPVNPTYTGAAPPPYQAY